MARIPKLDAAGKFLAADVNAQIDARTKATMRADLPALASELKIGGSGSGTGSRSVSGTVTFKPEEQALPPFVVATTTGATVEGVTLTAGQMAAFWYLNEAWHVMVHGQDTAWRSTAKPDTRIVVTPTGPTWKDETSGGTWTTPAQTGIVYTPASGTAAAGQVVTVTATIADSAKYRFPQGGVTSWTHTFPDPTVPIRESFDGPAGTALAGTMTDTGGKVWAGSGWTLDGAGAATASGASGVSISTPSNKADVTLTYGKVTGHRLDFGFGGHDRLQVSVFSAAGNKLEVYTNGSSVYQSPNTAIPAGGTLRFRYDGSTLTVWFNGTQLYTAAATIQPANFRIGTQGTETTASVSDLTITPIL